MDPIDRQQLKMQFLFIHTFSCFYSPTFFLFSDSSDFQSQIMRQIAAEVTAWVSTPFLALSPPKVPESHLIWRLLLQ
jgi:hypothetical protein